MQGTARFRFTTPRRWVRRSLLLVLLALAACSNLSPLARRQGADALALAHGWQPLRLPARSFILAGYAPVAATSQTPTTLTIYVEGDGMAWLSPSLPSDDPTPLRPVALELALRHSHGAAAYLARPCQYVEADERSHCSPQYWTDRRFATEVVDATSEAIDALKQRFHASRLILVGYSGGGAIAALVAAQRQDVVRLVTVAGNLDPQAWTRLHGVPALTGSRNPADAWQTLQDIPQLHFVGAEDTNVTQEVVAAYAARFPPEKRPKIMMVEGISHTCCWAARWRSLSALAFP